MTDTRSTVADFAPYVPTSILVRIASILRSTWVTFVTDSPLTWSWQQGRRNDRADMEGPLYVIGAPSRQIGPGKAVLATVDELKKYKPCLFRVIVRSPKGDPLPNAIVDLWHATTEGVYSYSSYNLRGRFTTDENGVAEVLTVAPGDYGAIKKDALRVGHFHLMLQDKDKKYERLTTQVYVCKNNNVDAMQVDFLNYVRKSRPQNMLQAWSVAANNGGENFFGFPELDSSDVDTVKAVEWWNTWLAEHAPNDGLKLVGGGYTDIKLNEKPGWFGF